MLVRGRKVAELARTRIRNARNGFTSTNASRSWRRWFDLFLVIEAQSVLKRIESPSSCFPYCCITSLSLLMHCCPELLYKDFEVAFLAYYNNVVPLNIDVGVATFRGSPSRSMRKVCTPPHY